MKKKTLLFLLIFLAVLFLLLKPVITGYTAYLKQNNLTVENESNLPVLQTSLQEYEQAIRQLKSEIRTLKEALNKTIIDKDKEIKSWMDKVTIANAKLEQKREALKERSRDYDELAENSAKVICCIERMSNPRIAYYKIRNNKIICDEKSGYKLKCSFG